MTAQKMEQADFITKMAFRAMMTLCGSALTIMYFNMTGNLEKVSDTTSTLNGRLIKIETQMQDIKDEMSEVKAAGSKRDQAIRDLETMILRK